MARLGDGYSTTINLAIAGGAINIGLTLYSTGVTPVGWEGGGAIPITTMQNKYVRTMHPKALLTLTELTANCSYDPAAYVSTFSSALQQNGVVTINFPDGSQFEFYGFLDEFKPQENTEGNEPIAQIKIIPTLHNGVGGYNAQGYWFTSIGVEVLPVYLVA